MGRRGRRRKQLIDDLKRREYSENLNKKNEIAISGDLGLEKTMDLQ